MQKSAITIIYAELVCLLILALSCARNDFVAVNETATDALIMNTGLTLTGKIKPRHAHEIESNRWTIGCETVDRDYTVYEHYKEYVGPLGAKTARIQSGWAKTEREKGVYDFAWLDAMVDDLLSQGVSPWFEFSYGNPVYEGGGGYNLGDGIPHSPEGLEGWDNYVRAAVMHFKDRVTYWEIWNEPNIRRSAGGGASPEDFADFVIRTAEIIREIQPDSRITGFSTAHIPFPYVRTFLSRLQAKKKLHLIDEVAFHAKPVIPDAKYERVDSLRMLVKQYSQRITIKQGENGCPSVDTTQSQSSLSQYNWTERSQAKWYLRDMLGDYARGIPHSIFTIIDIHYPIDFRMSGVLHKGMLKSTPEQTVDHPKQAYYAVQNAIAILDDTFKRINEISYSIQPKTDKPDVQEKVEGSDPFIFYAFRKKNTPQSLFMVWLGAERPAHEFPVVPVNIVYEGSKIIDPVYVDLLSGNIYDIHKEQWKEENGTYRFQDIPVYDSPVLIAERSIIRKQMLPILWWKNKRVM